MLQGTINETRQVWPQHFLTQIPARTTVEADQISVVAEFFFVPGIVRADFGINDAPREQIDSGHMGLRRESARQFHHIQYLPTGIRVPAQFHFLAAYQAMHTD